VQDAIDAGANVSAKDKNGTPALFAAVDTGNPEVLSVMTAAGADVNSTDEAKMTTLMHAVESRKPDMVSALISLGADVNATNEIGLSAWELSFDTEIDEILVTAGASVNYDVAVDPALGNEEPPSDDPPPTTSSTPEPTPPIR